MLRRLTPKTLEVDLSIGQRVKAARERLGISQRQLAIRSGFGHSYISKIENGYQGVETRSLREIANALMVSYDYIVKGDSGIGTDSAQSLKAEVLTVNEYKLIKYFREFDPQVRPLILAALDGITAHLNESEKEDPKP